MEERNTGKSVFIRFCILQAAYWSFYAALPAYISAYILDRGMSASLLGILLAVQMGSAFTGSVFWGRYVDRKQASRRFFLTGIASVACLSTLLFLFAGQALLLFLLYPLFGFMNGPIATTLDSWVIAVTGKVENGAKSRTFGTLGYAVTMLVSGIIISHCGYGLMPYIGTGLLAIALIVGMAQPEARRVRAETGAAKESPKALLKMPVYLSLVAMVFFTGMAIGPINNMKVLVFQNVGGDVGFLGWDAFIGCMIQSPFLLFSGKLKRIRCEYRLLGSAMCAFLYVFLVFTAKHPALVVAGTVFANINFGLLFPTMREMTERSVSAGLRTTAHSITDAAYGSVASMIAASWSGSVIESAGIGAMCVICMILETVALVICARILLSERNQNSCARKGTVCVRALGSHRI